MVVDDGCNGHVMKFHDVVLEAVDPWRFDVDEAELHPAVVIQSPLAMDLPRFDIRRRLRRHGPIRHPVGAAAVYLNHTLRNELGEHLP